MQNKFFDRLLLTLGKWVIILFSFTFWFLFLSIWSPFAGYLVGSISALILFVVMFSERQFEQCDNVNTQHAGTHADDLQRKKSFTPLSGPQLLGNRARSNPFPKNVRSKTKNI